MFLGLAGTSPIHAAPSGFLEGHLKIIALRGAELADETPSKGEAGDYAGYPLIILSAGQKKEIARVTADENGNYRIALPPGDYVLDVQGRGSRDVRATPQPFSVTSNQTVRVDMNVDTGIR
jgi:carboxypeptidase family protein